ncbi:serine hydrolase-domain-containing protein [Pseudomassariella vexata]|uniref:Serine hydrolase-domain-containing protein n=1 Tax=Pseudomassariella vexata TaxID=1141098 RepID=A0A1Y2EBJ1_9PEZI|nr:serine hydrolase-domain-containing protein [Pseudomassariella vexata]ORY68205.1 serine hydrolase-domain-containing protein [Pseudomassariella vexata]
MNRHMRLSSSNSTPSISRTSSPDPRAMAVSVAYNQKTLHLPRILCLHGGGTNARIFRAQCRVLSRQLEPYFRLVYVEAPFDSQPGPDVVSVYADYGPFKRWLRWLPDHAELEDRAAVKDINNSIQAAMDEDDDIGATGEWVGLLGFSQGAKLAASLLFRQQKRVEKLGAKQAGSTWKFAVLLAGRAPLVSLDPDVFKSTMLSDPSQTGLAGPPDLMEAMSDGHILKLPTIHVHGLQDPGLHLHRELLEDYCSLESVTVLEWDGAHRVPLKGVDVNPLVDSIVEVAKRTGALEN